MFLRCGASSSPPTRVAQPSRDPRRQPVQFAATGARAASAVSTASGASPGSAASASSQSREIDSDLNVETGGFLRDLPRQATFLALTTARNFEPFSATRRAENSRASRHSSTNDRQAPTTAAPLSRRESAIVLKSGPSRRISHIASTSDGRPALAGATSASLIHRASGDHADRSQAPLFNSLSDSTLAANENRPLTHCRSVMNCGQNSHICFETVNTSLSFKNYKILISSIRSSTQNYS